MDRKDVSYANDAPTVTSSGKTGLQGVHIFLASIIVFVLF